MTRRYAFHTDSSLFLVLEFCQGGDVYETMQARPVGQRRFSEVEAHFITAEITCALGKWILAMACTTEIHIHIRILIARMSDHMHGRQAQQAGLK